VSRSNPTDGISNPSRRWFEYAGGSDGGVVRYYDKEAKADVIVGETFQFILLDELATVKGWHDASDSGIFANEVRDTKQDTLVVRSFKGGELASGVYSSIRDRIGNLGGHFHSSCYIAFKGEDGKLAIGNIGFKGAALSSWMEFKKTCGTKKVGDKSVRAYYVDAIKITGYVEGTKGRVTYRVPKFELHALGEESQRQAVALDGELQSFLSEYFKRPRTEQSSAAKDAGAATPEPSASPRREPEPAFVDDDIPF
jgi:hypothetical protein